ncbi:MAG: beta-ketoacyl synthase N-terminal-like domain-containing protein, partial [Alphaproteobacteria bacterium]
MRERLALIADSVPALRSLLQEQLAGQENAADVYRGTVEKRQADDKPPVSGDPVQLAAAWVKGLAVDWSAQDRPNQRRISLPTYPFEQARHWLEPVCAAPAAAVEEPRGEQPPQVEAPAPARANQPDALEEWTHVFLVRILAQATGIPASRLSVDSPLETAGLTSMIINSLNARLEQDFPNLPKTLFFEHQTLRTMAAYLVREHTVALQQIANVPDAPVAKVQHAPANIKAPIQRSCIVNTGENRDIAIIGLAGRYPQADSLDEFWQNLTEGKDCIEEIPVERWNHRRYSANEKSSKWGGFLRDVDAFDPLFFGISPLEAERMDPQERLILQTVWQTFEDAGYSRPALADLYHGEVGVFIGVMYSEYQLFPALEHGFGISSSYGSIANRVSYILNLHGPSLAVDTMCSSSLTALHLACESIRRGECGLAVAGGVNVSIHPNKYLVLGQGKFAS